MFIKRVAVGYVFLISGIAIIIYPRISLTGAFIGPFNLFASPSFFLGAIFIIAGTLLVNESGLEKKIKLTSSIRRYPALARLAEDAASDQYVQRDFNHLLKELSSDNTEAGLKPAKNVPGTDVVYMRTRRGARLYYRKTTNGYDL